MYVLGARGVLLAKKTNNSRRSVGDVFLSIFILHCVVRVIVFSRLLCNDVIVCAHYFTIWLFTYNGLYVAVKEF